MKRTSKCEEEILKKREYSVVKGNLLIQKNRYNLSLLQQKSLAFICSLIQPAEAPAASLDIYPLEYQFNIREYCKVCGISCDSGKNYEIVKNALEALSNKSFWITFPENPEQEILCRWISKVRLTPKNGVVTIELDRDLAPYLFDLKVRFTQYQLYNILAMNSAFSIRLYELLKSYEFKKSVSLELEELKRLLMVDDAKSYQRFPDFRRRVLDVAEKEINALTDIVMCYETLTVGRKVVAILFHIKKKSLAGKNCAKENVNHSLSVHSAAILV